MATLSALDVKLYSQFTDTPRDDVLYPPDLNPDLEGYEQQYDDEDRSVRMFATYEPAERVASSADVMMAFKSKCPTCGTASTYRLSNSVPPACGRAYAPGLITEPTALEQAQAAGDRLLDADCDPDTAREYELFRPS